MRKIFEERDSKIGELSDGLLHYTGHLTDIARMLMHDESEPPPIFGRIDTPRGRALRAVLCDGVPVASAARAEGITHQPVYRAVDSAKKTLALAESCVRGSVP